ncbi:MAG: hypothetical protein N838_11295 [Thiohalocapsa sp. PB-PSB1]|nr:MAG: hypothetical protein N838_11295 [Thiohalocapsa sp. PB-PSB1]
MSKVQKKGALRPMFNGDFETIVNVRLTIALDR